MTTQKVNLSKEQREDIAKMLNGDTFKLFCKTISARADLKQIEAINDEEKAAEGTNRAISAADARAAVQDYRTFIKVVAESRSIAVNDKDFFLIEILPTINN